MGKQSSWQYSLNSNKNFTQPNHPPHEKICLVYIFSQFCFTPGEQTSTLWRNGDRGLKLTLGQQSSGQYSLTSNKNFTQLNHPLQEKIRLVSLFSQVCFIPGEPMSTLWPNGDTGLNSTAGQQNSGQYSLTSNKNFTQLNHPLQEKIR